MTSGSMGDDYAALIEDVRADAPAQLGQALTGGDGRPRGEESWGARGRDAVMRIPVSVRIVLGAAKMPVSKLMSLNRGSIIPLDRKVGDLVDIVVNDRVVARGEVVVVDEDASRFAVSVREVVHSTEG